MGVTRVKVRVSDLRKRIEQAKADDLKKAAGADKRLEPLRRKAIASAIEDNEEQIARCKARIAELRKLDPSGDTGDDAIERTWDIRKQKHSPSLHDEALSILDLCADETITISSSSADFGRYL